jgi:hypothetical protein
MGNMLRFGYAELFTPPPKIMLHNMWMMPNLIPNIAKAIVAYNVKFIKICMGFRNKLQMELSFSLKIFSH